jgi:hypothetical protein
MDEENVFLSLFAKTVSNAKLVAKVLFQYFPKIRKLN